MSLGQTERQQEEINLGARKYWFAIFGDLNIFLRIMFSNNDIITKYYVTR
jgi:hypothetical protein